MSKIPTLSPAITQPGNARVLYAFGDEVTILLDGKQTGGQYAAGSVVTQPGGGPPPHVHRNEDEWFIVLEGTGSFWANGKWTDVGPGGAVFLPRGIPHTFKNNTDKPLKMLVHTAPSGFETFFARCAEEFNKPGGPNMPRIVEIAGEHGIHFVHP